MKSLNLNDMKRINKIANTVCTDELQAIIISNTESIYNDFLISVLESRISEIEFNEFIYLLNN